MNYIEFYYNRDKYKGEDSSDFLSHYGILGQKWGQRRWQNADGTFNEAGKERYFGKGSKNSSEDDKVGSLYTAGQKIKELFTNNKEINENGQEYDRRYQWPDGSLTTRGYDLSEKQRLKKINVDMLEDYKNKESKRREAEQIEKEKKDAEIQNKIKTLDDEVVTNKYPKSSNKLTDEEFETIANDLDKWKRDFYDGKTDKHLNTLVADLGINALNKARGYGEAEVGNNNDREWFMYEDQTLGNPEIAYLYVKGYSKDYIKGMLDHKIETDSDEEYNKLYDKHPTTMFTKDEYHDGDQYIDALFELKEGSDQKIGSMKGSKVNPKYQNPDGSLTEKGQELRNKNYDKFKKKINQDLYKEYRDEIDKKINENRENNEKIYNNNLKKLDECLNEYGFDDEGYKKVKTNTAGKIDFQNNLNRFIYYEAEHEISEVPDVNNKLRSVDKKDIQSRFDKGEKAIQNFDKSYSKALNEVAKLYYDAYKNNTENPVTFNEFKNSINISKFKDTRNPVYLNYLGKDLNKGEGEIGYTTFIDSNIPGGFKSGYLVFDQNGNINATSSFDPEYRKVHVDNN